MAWEAKFEHSVFISYDSEFSGTGVPDNISFHLNEYQIDIDPAFAAAEELARIVLKVLEEVAQSSGQVGRTARGEANV